MRTPVAFTVILLITQLVNGQKLQDIDAIKLNTKFTLQLTEDGSDRFVYKVVSIEPFNGPIKIKVDGSEHILGPGAAQYVFVTDVKGSKKEASQ